MDHFLYFDENKDGSIDFNEANGKLGKLYIGIYKGTFI